MPASDALAPGCTSACIHEQGIIITETAIGETLCELILDSTGAINPDKQNAQVRRPGCYLCRASDIGSGDGP